MDSIRLTMSVGPREVEIQKIDSVQMRCPPPTPFENLLGRSGTWVEVRDAKGKALYQRLVHSPAFDETIEVTTDNPKQPFRRIRHGERAILFHVVVPDLDEARTVHLLQRTPRQKPGSKPNERVQVDLKHAPGTTGAGQHGSSQTSAS